MSPVRKHKPDSEETIISRMRQLAEENADRDAFVFYDKNMKRTALSRQEVWVHSQRFAAVLRQRGVCRGDVVCNTLPNSPQRLISSLGTVLAGAASMNGQIFLADGEDILHSLRKAKSKTIILDPCSENGVMPILDRLKEVDPSSGEIIYKSLPDLKNIVPISLNNDNTHGKTWIQTFEESHSDLFYDESVNENDTAFILTTSGSTGFSKLIPFTHNNGLNIGPAVQRLAKMNPDDIFYNSNSLGWYGGLPMIYIGTGMTRVLMDLSLGGPAPEDIAKTIIHFFNQERCDIAVLLPSDVVLVTKMVNSNNSLIRPLRVLLSGGGPLSNAIMKAIGPVTHTVVATYGATEFGLMASTIVLDPDSYENCCVGHPDVTVEIEIRGEDMEKLPVGKTGEIFTKNPNAATSYLNDPDKTKETFMPDGWLRTGDIGHFNSEGQLFVYCRKSFTINHKSFIHYPGWMESRINRHPDIEKSMVVGIPDPDTIEEVCICVIKKTQTNLTSDDVMAYFKSLFLTEVSDKITPTPKCCLFFDAFPLNANRKIDRKALRIQVMSRLGIETSDTPMRE